MTEKARKQCGSCHKKPANVRRSLNRALVCTDCFSRLFEEEVYQQCLRSNLFQSKATIIVAVSGGKDSTVLVHVLRTIMDRYSIVDCSNIELLAVDEGIEGYRNDSLEIVRLLSKKYSLPLSMMSFDEMFNGNTMDKVVEMIGMACSCTYCGVFRRRALDVGVNKIASKRTTNTVPIAMTGHNLDDCVETILLNILRGDAKRLQMNDLDLLNNSRIKPLSMQFEREIVLYAHLNKLPYHSTECKYAVDAFRSHARTFVRQLQTIRPQSLIDILHGSKEIADLLGRSKNHVSNSQLRKCSQCDQFASSPICNVCKLLADLNTFN
ncbi:hypothetical protein ACOME3_005654 [Neoechinorhynchus agilis]